jgi:hypothetical protein
MLPKRLAEHAHFGRNTTITHQDLVLAAWSKPRMLNLFPSDAQMPSLFDDHTLSVVGLWICCYNFAQSGRA